jgi:hypothetical protein
MGKILFLAESTEDAEKRSITEIYLPGGFMRELESTGIACLNVPLFSGTSGAKAKPFSLCDLCGLE